MASLHGFGKDYPAAMFGIVGNGRHMNTRSIQAAINHLHTQGGGQLVFGPGRYLTGSLHLKSGVGLQLNKGAVLLGSASIFDYDQRGSTALLFADSAHHISLTGQGTIDGQGAAVVAHLVQQIRRGIIADPLQLGRPRESIRPMLIHFRRCDSVTVTGLSLVNAACWVQTYVQCSRLLLAHQRVSSRSFWNNDGIDLDDCTQAMVRNNWIDAADDGICLKSRDSGLRCEQIVIRDNWIRSSANAIKLGTASFGGFRQISILNNRVESTYRSAVALESVDGGVLEEVLVDSLVARQVGNVLFLRLGERRPGRKGQLRNITVRNVDATVAAGKPDAGYAFEGPVEHGPRNTSPLVVMAGLPGQLIAHVRLAEWRLHHPGGGSTAVAERRPDQLDQVPELPAAYPEFSMFRELPAWALFARHVEDLRVQQIQFTAGKKDYRPALVLDHVRQAVLASVTANGLALDKDSLVVNASEAVRVEE